MSLSLTLPAGTLAVYGPGIWMPTPSGLVLPQNFRVGTVYNIWDGGSPYVYGGDVVFWDEKNVLTRVVTNQNLTYTIIPARLVTIDYNVDI